MLSLALVKLSYVRLRKNSVAFITLSASGLSSSPRLLSSYCESDDTPPSHHPLLKTCGRNSLLMSNKLLLSILYLEHPKLFNELWQLEIVFAENSLLHFCKMIYWSLIFFPPFLISDILSRLCSFLFPSAFPFCHFFSVRHPSSHSTPRDAGNSWWEPTFGDNKSRCQ